MKKQSSLTKPINGIGPVVFDLETNGLLGDDNLRIHCIAIHYLNDDTTETYNDESPGKGMSSPVVRAVQYLQMADCLIGHNILGFDLPVIKTIYPFFDPIGSVIDTLLLSRLYHPDLYDIDISQSKRISHNFKELPDKKLHGRHSLESYGYRLGEYKGNFGKDTDWKEWSQEMEDYCAQDVKVTEKLCDHFHPYLTGSYSNTR